MGIFSGIEKAKATEGGVYVLPGVYRFRILALKQGRARAGWNFFVAEFLVLESSNPDRPVGSVCSWMVKMDPANLETALGNIKRFASIATDTAVDLIDEPGLEMLTSAENPCAGVDIRCSAVNTLTRAKKDFTKCTWLAAA